MKLKARNLYAILVVLLFAGFYAFYQYRYSWIELPMVSHFEMSVFADKYLTGTLKLSDLFWSYCEHGMFGTTLLYLLNVELFSFKTTFEIVVNVINVTIVGALCVHLMSKSLPKDKGGIMYYLSVAVCGYFVFNVLQGGCSGMDMQVRLGFLFGVFALLAMQRLMDRGFERWSVILFVLLSLLYINVFGSLYCMAATGTMLVAIVLRIIALRKWDHTYFLIIGMQIVCWLLYFCEYPNALGSAGSAVSGVASGNMALADRVLYYLQALVLYSGSFVLGYDSIADGKITMNAYMAVGLIVLLLIFWAAFRFFKNKQYRQTWVPLMFIGYSYAVFCMVILGRQQGVTWVTGTWYHVHTKTAMVGMIWILAYDVMQRSKIILSGVTILACVFLLVSNYFGLSAMWQKAPYVRIYLENRQKYVFVDTVEEMPVDASGQTPLGNGLSQTMNGLEILRKHKLSVFSDPEKFPSPTYGIDPGEYRVINGMWDDGWSSAGAKIAVYTQQEDKVLLKGYYPFEITGNEVITITAGDLVTEYTITQPEIEIWVQVPQDQLVNLKVNCNFYKVNEPDVRQLAFLFQGIENYTEDLK